MITSIRIIKHEFSQIRRFETKQQIPNSTGNDRHLFKSGITQIESRHFSPVKLICFHHSTNHRSDKTCSLFHVSNNSRLCPLFKPLHRGQPNGSGTVTRVKQRRYIMNLTFPLHPDRKQRHVIPKFQLIPSRDRNIRPA